MIPFRAVEESVDDDTQLLLVEGDLDMRSAEDLRNSIDEAATDRKPKLVIDMTGVPFMDSSALASLMSAQKALGPDVKIIVICPENLRRIFEVTRLDSILTVVSSLPEALVA